MNNSRRATKKEAARRLKEATKYSTQQIRKYEDAKKKFIDESQYLTEMKDSNNILEIDGLKTHFFTDMGVVKAVDGVSFNVPKGATVGVVGESGCGKSVTSLSIMRLVQGPSGQIVEGNIRFNTGERTIDLAKAPMEEVRKIRGNDIAMIFQEPMTSMNPVFTTGYQIDEVITIHRPELTKEQVKAKTIEMLDLVGINRPEEIYKAYPHELSGGMRQRAMIAMALACDPKVIVADEPTTALDVTIQAQILDLLRNLKDKIDASIILITHDLGVVAEMADYVVVMYAGRVIEHGTARDIYKNPKHPYTVGLIKSRPNALDGEDRLYSIPGSVPNPVNMPNHCYFRDRCDRRTPECDGAYPDLFKLDMSHSVACYNHDRGDN
jgi:peptide/nickel transport system ATP-binding protein